MPFVANTPESLLGRADSKNPNSTCRGLTSSGRPCRRAIAASSNQTSSLRPPASKRPRTPDPRDESLYCWQHKEQASMSARSSPGPRATATPILEEEPARTSLDTLADRLGLVDLQDKQQQKRKNRRPRHSQGAASEYAPSSHKPPSEIQGKKKEGRLQFCFCFSMPIEEVHKPKPARPQPRPVQQQATSSVPSGNRKSSQNLNVSTASPAKSSRKSSTSHVAQLKDLIPDTVDASTASALLTELARPYVESEEAGYIYMFWLAPATRSGGAPGDAARDMLAPPSQSARSRRASDVVSAFADNNDTTTTSRGGQARGKAKGKKMVLKIGRAANVQRRMNQWQRQCGRDVEVLRFYPFTPSTSSGLTQPRPTPHAHRVERLIHIELAGLGLKADNAICAACGREHREWFEVDASRNAVREVDAVIRRWVDWDETA